MEFSGGIIPNDGFRDSSYLQEQGPIQNADTTDKTTLSLPNLRTIFGLGRVLLTSITSPSQEQANQNRENKETAKENIQTSFSFRSYIPDLSALWTKAKTSFPSFSFLRRTKPQANDPYQGRETFSDPALASDFQKYQKGVAQQNPEAPINTTRESISDEPDFEEFFRKATGNDYTKT